MHIVIADDHSLIIEGFKKIIHEHNASFKISAANNKVSLLKILASEPVDLVFQDLKFGQDDARMFIHSLKQQYPNTRIVIISTIIDLATIQMLRNMEVDGYISKSDDSRELLAAIQHIAAKKCYWSKEIKDVLNKQQNYYSDYPILTKREQEILLLIVKGKTTKEIGQYLLLSDKTIETHRSNLFLKFDVTNVASLVRTAVLAGYIE